MRPKWTLITAIFLIATFGSINALADCIEDPVSYWTLDQDTQPFINEILNGTDGTCAPAACPVVDNNGQVGSAQQFNGTSAGITIADSGASIFDFETNGSFSISVWFRRNAGFPTINEVLIGRYAINQTHFWIGVNPSGQPTFRLWDTSAFPLSQIQREAYGRVTGTANVADGQWHHVVAVRDGVTNRNLLYVDGLLAGSSQITYAGTFTADSPAEIGRLTNNYYFSGSIDEVAVFDTALSETTIGEIYDTGDARTALCSENTPPTINSTPNTNAAVGEEYVYEPTAEDVDGDTLVWSLTNPPAGMTIDPATGVISWTPTEASPRSVDIFLAVTDNFDSDQQEFTITVSGATGTDTSTDTDTDVGGGSSSSSGGGGCFIATSEKANYRFLMEVAGALAFLVMLLPVGLIRKNR